MCHFVQKQNFFKTVTIHLHVLMFLKGTFNFFDFARFKAIFDVTVFQIGVQCWLLYRGHFDEFRSIDIKNEYISYTFPLHLKKEVKKRI